MEKSQCLTLQFGPRANHLAVHYWNATSVVDPSPRKSFVWSSGESPLVAIVDQPLFNKVFQASKISEELVSLLPENHWLRMNSVALDHRHYHQIGKSNCILDDFEESIRVLAEHCDRLSNFQCISELNEPYSVACTSTLEHLSDFYPKRDSFVLSTSDEDNSPVIIAKFLAAATEHSALMFADMQDDPILASSLDTLNLAGFPWLVGRGFFSIEFNGRALFSKSPITNHNHCAIVRGDSDYSGHLKTFREPQRPFLMVHQPETDRWEFNQPEGGSVTILDYNHREMGLFIDSEFLSNSGGFSRPLFLAQNHEPGEWDSLQESLEGLTDLCCN